MGKQPWNREALRPKKERALNTDYNRTKKGDKDIKCKREVREQRTKRGGGNPKAEILLKEIVQIK